MARFLIYGLAVLFGVALQFALTNGWARTVLAYLSLGGALVILSVAAEAFKRERSL